MNQEKLKRELVSFEGTWEGGYYEGNPLEPLSRSTYGQIGYISVLRATYLRCIKPYINAESVALEIGAGRGAWTKALLEAKEVWALDAMSAEYNHFWEYIGNQPHVNYIQVEDFSCSSLPDNHFNYMFSFGCLCHVSFEGIEEYAKNLFPKLKSGSNCFWLVADYDKFNCAVGNLSDNSIWSAAAPSGRRFAPVRKMLEWLIKVDHKPQEMPADADNNPSPGRWYNAGIQPTCEMLKRYGYQILDEDVDTSLRDPIIHFFKP
jgi:hypothetical protein